MSTQDAGSAGAGGGPGSGGDKSTSSGTVNVSTGAKAVTSLSVGGSGTGGGGGGGQLSATAVVGGGGATVTTTTIPIDLASASKVLVRPEKTTMPTTTYRFGSAPGSQMRVVIPSSAAQQTFYRQPANIKQVFTSSHVLADATTNRTQISTLPAARTVTQNASLTVSRAPQTTPTTVSYHVSNRVTGTPVVAANLQATTRATINGPIRISTPPIQVATNNNTTTYVQRQPPTVVPSRSVTAGTATAATIISQSSSGATTTLVPNFQMSTPLFRAGTIGAGAGQVAAGAPRARVVTQTTLSANHHQVTGVTNNAGGAGGGSTVVNNVVTPGGGSGAAPQAVAISSASGGGATVASSGTGTGSGQSQALVATLSAVLQGPRQVSTLLYTNNSNAQQYTIGPNQQRLALATTLSPQRPQATVTAGIRPTIQRLPTAGIRVSTGSLNFRSPMLASTTVLTTIASSTGTVGTVTNTQQQQQQQQVQQQAQQQLQQQQRTVTATGTPAGATAISNAIPARIIQVQNPPSGTTGTAQIVNRLQTNLLNIQPLIVSNSRLPQSALQPGITIAQVGKLTQVATAGSGVAGNDGSGGGGNSGSGSATTTTLQTASGQQIVVSTGGAGPGGGGGGGGGGSPATTAIIAGNLIAANHPASQATHQGQITQIVNVNAGQPTVVSAAVSSSGQQQQPQIVTVSQASGGAATAGTVIPLPLALTSARNVGGAGAGSHSPLSIVTGGIVRTAGGAAGGTGVSGVATSIGSVLPIAKVTPQQQQTLVSMESGTAGSGVTQHYSVASSGGVSGGPSLYIQTRPGGAGLAGAGGKPGGATGATLSVVSSGPTGAGGAGSGTVGSAASTTTFLPTSTFYYERLTSSPATSVPSSTGAVTISSTGIPVSSSTFVQAVAASSSSSTITTASAISGPVFSIPAASSVINSSGGGSGANTTVVTVAAAGNPTLAPYGSTGSFAIVQASPAGTTVGARTTTLATGPVHGIVPASVQTGSAAAGGNTSVAGSIVSVSQPASSGSASSTTAQIVPIRFHSQMLIDSSGQTQQIIVSSGGAGGGSGSGPASIMPMIPVGTSGGTTTVVTATSKQQSAQQESPQSSILRKRTLVETASGTIKATPVGKDLTAALMAVERERSVREQQEAQLHLLQQQQQQQQQHHHLVAELRDLANASPLHLSRPPSTDGSTTVSATSSPGLDEQEEEELRAQAYANRASNAISGDGHFKPVQDEHHFLQQQQQSQQQSQQHHREIISLHCTESFPTNLGTSTTLSVVPMANHTALVSIGGTGSSNGGAGSYEQSPRKKARKQLLLPMTDGHHHHHLPSVKSNSSSSSSSSSSSVVTNSSTSSTNTAGGQQHPYLGGPDDERMDTSGTGLVVLGNASSGASSVGPTGASNSGGSNHQHNNKHNNSNSISTSMNNSNNIHNNNNVRMDPPSGSVSGAQVGGNVISVVTARQNLTLRKPHNISMLQSYKQTWKSANNHFQRYTDVKQREERRPTVMDIANQSHILQKVNGWKIYHLSAQIEDLSDLESQAYGKLEKMLRAMESSAGSNGSAVKLSTDVERINELLKGNMQRSKIIIDGINDARTQIMKIFQHKPHVSDIILRCASKRNFKKREKT
ncbi:serine-rich adhesin for platelets [Anopheles moucheti]|uniref:serine-rich adhesin for platelets n=1 Tax=Anopheles moucheti TaxID=186751 RepID=UPI0022F02806|nr:serine-rich adhesin for platelets [Anopheles moucheti]